MFEHGMVVKHSNLYQTLEPCSVTIPCLHLDPKAALHAPDTRAHQCFCFQNQIKYFFGYFDPEKILLDKEKNNFRGDLTDILSKKHWCTPAHHHVSSACSASCCTSLVKNAIECLLVMQHLAVILYISTSLTPLAPITRHGAE